MGCGAVRCGAVRCGGVRCGGVGWGGLWCGVVRCGAVRWGAVRCGGVGWGGVGWCGVWCGVVRCGAVGCGAVRCGAVRCGAVGCGAVRCGAVWCGVVRCGAVRCGAARRTGTFAAPRWCPAIEPAPCRRRAVGAGATLASGGRGEATYVHLSPTGLHVWPREGSWTVGGRGGPGLTQGRRTRNRDVSRLASSVAMRVGNPSHSYHPEGF